MSIRQRPADWRPPLPEGPPPTQPSGHGPPPSRNSKCSKQLSPLIGASVVFCMTFSLMSYLFTGTFDWGFFKMTFPTKYTAPATSGGKVFTPEELSRYDGSNPNLPIYLALKGRVYDVSSGERMYGKGMSYNVFAGRDASRGYVSGCFSNKDNWDLRGMTDDQMKVIYWYTAQPDAFADTPYQQLDQWVKFYEEHESYFYVGQVLHPEVDPDAPLPSDKC